MKHGSTNFLRMVLAGISAVVALICIMVLPKIIYQEMKSDFDYLPILLGLYITALPFLYAVVQGFRLLKLIDMQTAFSDKAVQAFRMIKYCGLIISGIFVFGLPYIFHVAQNDDAPGLVAMSLLIAMLSFVVASFAAVMQRLFQSAVTLKTENDLTV